MSRPLCLVAVLVLSSSLAAGCNSRSRGGTDRPPPPGTDSGVGGGDGGTTDCTTDAECAELAGECGTASCTDGTCQVGSAAPDGTSCDDEDACTSDDACVAGACIGSDVDCSSLDDGVCIVGACNADTGACEAVPAMDGTSCDDGDVCTDGDACASGSCMPGGALDCSAMTDGCNVGMCSDAMGGCYRAPLADGVGCDDGMNCTTADSCRAGTCVGTAVDCSAFDDMCNVGACNPATGACVANPVVDGSACDDFNACTRVDRCSAGACTGTSPVSCTFLDDQCNTGVCDMITGACNAVPMADGTICNDGDPVCTPGTDRCTAGVCGGPSVCCGPQDFRINEVHGGDTGGAGDYIEIINTSSCTLDASMISFALRYDCDSSTITYNIPAGTMVPAGGLFRVVDSSSAVLRSNERYIGTNICHNPASRGWTAICQGPCNLTACSNFVDYVEENTTTARPTAAPTCASFSPSPVNTTGQSATQSVNRVAFTGSGRMGQRSDYRIGAATR